MALKTYKFNTIDEMDRFLNGVLLGGKDLPTLVYDLVGKTAKFTKPSVATCTFVAGASSDGGLTFSEIKSQLETAISGLSVGRVGQRITLSGGAAGVAFDNSTGLSILGFSNVGGSSVVRYGPPNAPSPPRLIQAFGFGTQLAVIVEEN